MTVASSSRSPGDTFASSIAKRESSSASNTRKASSRPRRSPGGTGSSLLTGEGCRTAVTIPIGTSAGIPVVSARRHPDSVFRRRGAPTSNTTFCGSGSKRRKP